MNWSTKILNCKRSIPFLSIPLKIYKIIHFPRKSPQIVRFFSTSVSVSGYIIRAGCCFSKQEESPLLSNLEESSLVNETAVEVSNHEICTNLWKMKRNADSIKQPVSSVLQTGCCSKNVTEQICKKVKTENDLVIPESESYKYSSIRNEKDKPNTQSLSLKPNGPNHKKKEFEDKDAVLTTGVSDTKTKETQKQKKENPVKQRPNYFVAIQISDDQIVQSLQHVQDHILQKEEKLLKSMISLKTLHITLMVTHIADQEAHSRAMEALQNVHSEFDDDLSQNPLQIKLQGLSHFRNRVLYAQISNEEATSRLTSLAKGVKKHFENVSLFTQDKGFTPHMTVAKIDFKQNRKGVKKIDPVLYEAFANEYFGSQTVESIQLCKMTGPKNEAGYYTNQEFFFTGHNPSERLNALKKSLSIEERKKDVKEIINSLMKEKMK